MANNNDKKKTNLIDSYNKNTTNKIVGLIDKNPKDWQQLIANNPVYSVSGQNPVTYKGVNAISLAITNADRGNTDNRFMTRRAVEKAGLEIKESAKAMQISYLRPRERDVNGEKKQIPMMSVGYVYSANDIKGIKPAPKDIAALQLSQEQLIEKSAIPVVRSTKQLISEFNAEKNEIQIASEIFDQGGDGLISNYAALATKAAVDQHYTKDSQDMKDFKSQMSAALITQSVGAKFALKGNVKDVKNSFDTEFLKDAKQGMKAVRSSAKIANIVANGKSFEMIKEKNSKPLTPVKKNIKEKSERLNKAKDGVEKKPTQREKLNKQRTNAKEKGRSSR
jgi:hypothetical protein